MARSSGLAAGAVKRAGEEAEKTHRSITGLGTATGRLDAALLGLRTAIGSQAVIGLGAGALAAIAFGKAIRSIIGLTAQFETELNVFQATTGATADEMRQVSVAAERLGADITLPAVSAGDAAEAMTELAKAGLSVQDAIRGARGVLQLATAANIDNAQATQLAASALNAFGLAGDQAVRVADVLANSANQAQGSISDMGLALSQAAAVGRQVGLSLEDTSGFLTILAREGLRGSDAGTSLRVALIRLVNPTAKASAELEKLGVSVRDAQGNLRPDFFTNLGIALQGVSKQQRDATLALIGGQDAVRALSILTRQSITDVIGVRDALAQQGTAADIAAARTKGLAGAGSNLSNTLQTIGIEIGQRVAPALTRYTNELAAGIAATAQNAQVQRLLSQSVGVVSQAFSALEAILSTVAPVLLTTAGVLESTVSAVGVGPILAGVAAYKLLRAAMIETSLVGRALESMFAALTAAQLRMTAAMAGGAGATGAARAAFAGLGASLTSLLTSPAALAIGFAALAGAFAFIITRENSLERANRELKASTDALVDSLGKAQAAASDLQTAVSNVRSDRLSVQTAQLATAQARQALANSDAARGSFERAQLENALAVAEDNLRLATDRLQEAIRNEASARAVSVQATRNSMAARQAEVDAVARSNDAIATGTTKLIDNERTRTRAVQESVAAIRERARALEEQGDATSISTAKQLRAVANLEQELGRFARPREVRIILRADNARAGLLRLAQEFPQILRETGDDSAEGFAFRFTSGIQRAGQQKILAALHPIRDAAVEFFRTTGTLSGQAMADAIVAPLRSVQAQAQKILDQITSQARGRASTLQERALDLDIAGATPQAKLANLKQQEANQRAIIAAVSTNKDERVKAKEELDRILNEERTLEGQIASDVKQKTSDIQQARADADQAILDSIGRGEARQQNAITAASFTPGLQDDIKAQTAYRDFLRRTRDNLANTVRDAKARATEFARLTAELIQTTGRIRDLKKQQQEALRQKRQDRLDQRLEALQIRIQTAQITGNEALQRTLLNREIDELERQIRGAKRGSIRRLQLIQQLRQAQKELSDLKKEQDKSTAASNAFREAQFEFLQTQTGFAANLLGNLIPSGATGGLVGGTAGAPGSRPGVAPLPDSLQRSLNQGLQGKAAAAEARRIGPTKIGQDTELNLLREIRALLKAIHAGNTHPEAHTRRKMNRTDFELESHS